MIQRIQSIFLLLVSICMVLVLLMPLWEKQGDDKKLTFSTMGLAIEEGGNTTQQPTYYLVALALLASAVAIFSLFSFRNRLRQMQLGALNSLVMASLMGLSIWKITEAEKLVQPLQKGAYGIAFWLIVVALIANTVANRFIRRDEKLVKSADRIR